jgi:hypothetical protein
LFGNLLILVDVHTGCDFRIGRVYQGVVDTGINYQGLTEFG